MAATSLEVLFGLVAGELLAVTLTEKVGTEKVGTGVVGVTEKASARSGVGSGASLSSIVGARGSYFVSFDVMLSAALFFGSEPSSEGTVFGVRGGVALSDAVSLSLDLGSKGGDTELVLSVVGACEAVGSVIPAATAAKSRPVSDRDGKRPAMVISPGFYVGFLIFIRSVCDCTIRLFHLNYVLEQSWLKWHHFNHAFCGKNKNREHFT